MPLRANSDVATAPAAANCSLEAKVQRVRWTLDRPVGIGPVHLDLRFFDASHKWLADELIDARGLDSPIIPIAGLFNPAIVASAHCIIDGYEQQRSSTAARPFVALAPAPSTGQKPCRRSSMLIVDGGDDADFESAVVGPNWVLFRVQVSIARFIGDYPTLFAGDVFSATLDGRSEQRALVYGPEGQSVSFLFTDVAPGFHQIDFGSWPPQGQRSFCLRTDGTVNSEPPTV